MYTKDIEDALNDAILELYKAQAKLNHALYTWLFYLGFPDDIKARFSIKFNINKNDENICIFK